MKKLTEIIVKYSKKYVNENNDWYNWREINEDKLPMGIELPKGNQYLKNVILKKELNKKWKESQSDEDKLILIKYYIATWGGIHTNSSESMEEYSKLSASQLIKNGKKGIASWSKAIVVHDPNEYANNVMKDPKYPLLLLQRIITLSLRTNEIVKTLPLLDID